ncbi:MAG: hypothetical protein SFT68_02730 [Rickettsiaceae bacterium]|nr:hypothetical protein [Rickettsiaceae bacterium]
MSAELYLAICFVIFIFLTSQKIYLLMNNTLEESRNTILESINNAVIIYNQAKEKNDEAKNLLAQLEFAKKYINEKEEREIQYDLETRKRKFTDSLKVKQQQFEHICSRKLGKLNQVCLSKLVSLLKDKFVVTVNQNEKLSEEMTNIILKKNTINRDL